jgi:Secretion system C-terminal sorting domain
MKNKKTIASVAFLLFGLGYLDAQENPNASGGDATGIGGTVAYSLGQIVYTTNVSPSGTVSQGVQQAYEIYMVGIKETELNISLTVFPNPTTNNLTLQIGNYKNEKLSYQLFDIQGKQLSNGQVMAQETQINTSSLPPGNYLINIVNQENKKIQSFTIIKN